MIIEKFVNEVDYKADLQFEERGEGDAKVREVIGYPAKFNKPSLDLGGFTENILPGFFSRAIEEKDDVRALVNHDPNMMLGRTRAGTCQLKEDSTGLRMEVQPADTSVAQNVALWIKRKEMDQGSFRFSVGPNGDNWRMQNGKAVRDLIVCRSLKDVSVVTFPAYEDTSAMVRSVTELAGINFAELAGTLVRIEHKLEVRSADRDLIAQSIEALNKAQLGMGETKFNMLEVQRRRLMLADREIS